VDADTDRAGFQVAVADDKHAVDVYLFGVRDLPLHVIAAGIQLATNLMGAKLGLNGAGAVRAAALRRRSVGGEPAQARTGSASVDVTLAGDR